MTSATLEGSHVRGRSNYEPGCAPADGQLRMRGRAVARARILLPLEEPGRSSGLPLLAAHDPICRGRATELVSAHRPHRGAALRSSEQSSPPYAPGRKKKKQKKICTFERASRDGAPSTYPRSRYRRARPLKGEGGSVSQSWLTSVRTGLQDAPALFFFFSRVGVRAGVGTEHVRVLGDSTLVSTHTHFAAPRRRGVGGGERPARTRLASFT